MHNQSTSLQATRLIAASTPDPAAAAGPSLTAHRHSVPMRSTNESTSHLELPAHMLQPLPLAQASQPTAHCMHCPCTAPTNPPPFKHTTSSCVHASSCMQCLSTAPSPRPNLAYAACALATAAAAGLKCSPPTTRCTSFNCMQCPCTAPTPPPSTLTNTLTHPHLNLFTWPKSHSLAPKASLQLSACRAHAVPMHNSPPTLTSSCLRTCSSRCRWSGVFSARCRMTSTVRKNTCSFTPAKRARASGVGVAMAAAAAPAAIAVAAGGSAAVRVVVRRDGREQCGD